MRTKRGLSLVELMIVIAILGICTAGALTSSHRMMLVGMAELQRERALLLLEYEADCLLAGQPVDPTVQRRLTEHLPEAAVERRSEAGAQTLTVRWRDPTGKGRSRSLYLLGGAP